MFLNNICHYTPPFKYSQNEALELMKSHIELNDKERRVIDMIYRFSAIDYRYSMVGDLKTEFEGDRLFIDEKGKLLAPIGTAKRNQFYERGARTGFIETAKSILLANDIEASEITHVITVSCTGFYAPGPDYDIVNELNMNPQTQRYHIGFMGCYAAFPALRMAEAFLKAQKDTKVLVICLELCTLHLQFESSADQLLSGALFADGAAGTICTNEPLNEHALQWLSSTPNLIGEGEADMAWTIGDQGFDMRLSTYVPKLLEKHASSVVHAAFPDGKPDYEILSLHPGGKAIIDRVQNVFEESDESLQYSRKILREYGNMSSATVLFVLEEVQKTLKSTQKTLSMGFGPGLTVETALLQKV